MANELTLKDIDDAVQDKVFEQDYSGAKSIDGVKLKELKNHISEDGDFSEIIRINSDGSLQDDPSFKIAQINRSMLEPGGLKAWHLHLKQDEFWYVAPQGKIFVGLWDLRKDSSTKNLSMRVVLGGGESTLLFIPKGVAHGLSNLSKKRVSLYYFINEQFNPENPDEKRLKWDSLGADFWSPKKE